MKKLLLAFLPALLLLSCTKDYMPVQKWSVSVADADGTPVLSRRARYESLTVNLTGPSEGTQVQLSSTAPWLKVKLDVLAPDSIVPIETEDNGTGKRREASIVFTDASNPLNTASLSVVQLSELDDDTNGDEARDVLYVGYGYNIYKSLESPMAVCTKAPVLDYARMLGSGGVGVYEVVQDCHLSRTETKYVSSNDIHAYGENLTRQQTGDSDNPIEGCRENCVDAVSFTDPAFGSLEQQNFGHGSLEKAVAARVVDRGALMDLKRRNMTPYTTIFADYMRNVRTAKDAARRKKAIEQTLVDFGTHVIIQVDLGGRIDYTFTMTKEGAFETYDDMMKQVEYTLGRVSETDMNTNSQVSSSKSATGAITVKGGSPASRAVLEGDIRGLSPNGQINPSHITDWLSTINYSETPERDPNLDVIHFELIPLWDLVYPEMRQEFMDATYEMVDRSDFGIPASMAGMDVYEIPTTDADLFDFSGAGEDGSLCRILYCNGDPILEVCSEYVPKIRTDQRVTVVYPIYYQHIRLNQGIFIGDGVHQPAYVGFGGADCYVNPFSDLSPRTILDKVYYVNGNLAKDSPAKVSGLTSKERAVKDDAFYYIYGSTEETPIVKIGSQFWTRKDVPHNMGFTKDPDSRKASVQEYVVDGVLYSRFYYDVGYYPRRNNAWTWGYVPNVNFEGDPNMRWYLPSPADVQNLHKFLGFNPKALFRGQASGFDAGFNGYYGTYDIIKGKSYGDGRNAVRHSLDLNVFASRPIEELDEVLVAVLDRNYRFTFRSATGNYYDQFYPVRPVRGYMFEYPTLQTIKDNTY